MESLREIKVVFIDNIIEMFKGTHWVVKHEIGIISIEKRYAKNKEELRDTIAHIALQQIKYIMFI